MKNTNIKIFHLLLVVILCAILIDSAIKIASYIKDKNNEIITTNILHQKIAKHLKLKEKLEGDYRKDLKRLDEATKRVLEHLDRDE